MILENLKIVIKARYKTITVGYKNYHYKERIIRKYQKLVEKLHKRIYHVKRGE